MTILDTPHASSGAMPLEVKVSTNNDPGEDCAEQDNQPCLHAMKFISHNKKIVTLGFDILMRTNKGNENSA